MTDGGGSQTSWACAQEVCFPPEPLELMRSLGSDLLTYAENLKPASTDGVQLATVLYQFFQAAASCRAVFGLCYAEFVASRVLRTVRFRVCGAQGFCSKMAPS